jgi:hypothetical protein
VSRNSRGIRGRRDWGSVERTKLRIGVIEGWFSLNDVPGAFERSTSACSSGLGFGMPSEASLFERWVERIRLMDVAK